MAPRVLLQAELDKGCARSSSQAPPAAWAL